MITRKLLVSRLMLVCMLLSACAPTAPPPAPGPNTVFGTFTYTDTEANPDGGGSATFHRPIAWSRVEVWRAGILVSPPETATNDAGRFEVTVPPMPDGTDTTVLIYATNQAAQVLAGGIAQAFSVRKTLLSSGTTPLDFSENFTTVEQIRSFNAAQDIRLAFDFAQARRDPHESEVIPQIFVSFIDNEIMGTHYNPPASGLLIHHSINSSDLVILHEYAHFLEDKIGGYLLMPIFHDTCFTSQRCQNPEDCANLPGTTMTQLINSPENAWMEGFADYFAMAVKRANPLERFDLTSGGAMTESELNHPAPCLAVGRTAFDGHPINDEMIERFVAGALWALSDGGSSDAEVFQIFDHELDGSATGLLPNIRQFCTAWSDPPRRLDQARISSILGVNIPSLRSNCGR